MLTYKSYYNIAPTYLLWTDYEINTIIIINGPVLNILSSL